MKLSGFNPTNQKIKQISESVQNFQFKKCLLYLKLSMYGTILKSQSMFEKILIFVKEMKSQKISTFTEKNSELRNYVDRVEPKS
jgi:hypothetical protein